MLMHAATYGTAPAIRELLKNGADPKRCDGGTDRLLDSVLYRASYERFMGNSNTQLDGDVIEVFREFKIRPADAQRFLSQAVRNQSIAGIVYAVKDLGADVNHVGEYGNTPLYSAFKAGGGFTERKIAVIDALVKMGADPGAGSSAGNSLLAWARTNLSEQEFWPRLEAAMLQKENSAKRPSQSTVEKDVSKSGVLLPP
jgi:ankyrin repeat protein